MHTTRKHHQGGEGAFRMTHTDENQLILPTQHGDTEGFGPFVGKDHVPVSCHFHEGIKNAMLIFGN